MSNLVRRGRLIVFEGTDGTGKSTQLQLLGHYLQDEGYAILTTREPTEGRYGQKIRSLYMDRNHYSREEELELFLADRREHVQKVLAPALEQGKVILCDRYFLSTVAYQGARGFDPEHILELNRFAPEPDLALLFQVPLDTGLDRITFGRGDVLNDFEQRDNLARVAAIFSSIKRPYIRPIDARGSIAAVHRLVIEYVRPLLPVLSTDQV
ncbi:dTMP kinase [Desulfocastanea catecholica]